ncbi:MAG: Fe-S-cluster containining protein [Saprospiraceae bacterium]|jgi:Fe-S-cluster containining protein
MIQEILVSEEVIDQKFICNLKACKGACCWEGEWGAPLEKEELAILENAYEAVKPFLKPEAIERIKKVGLYEWNELPNEYGTGLMEDGACVFMNYTPLGIATCGIEQANRAGVTDFKKPISCHLYPIRVSKNEDTNFEALNYDEWDICSAACALGEKEQVPVYKFLKEPIERKYGEEFYKELDIIATLLAEEKKK